MANHLYFPALDRYDTLSPNDWFTFYPIVADRNKYEGGIDGLARKINMASILSWIEENGSFNASAEFEVKDEGTSVGTGFDTLNFIGPLVTATDGSDNEADITITGQLMSSFTDVSESAYMTIGHQFSNTLTTWEGNQPDFANGVAWLLDYPDNTYMMGYDPVNNDWKPFLAKDFLLNGILWNVYTDNAEVDSDRTIGFGGNDILFTNTAVTNTFTNTAGVGGGGDFTVKSADTGTDSGHPIIFYTSSMVRNNHTRTYSDGYTTYADWISAANSTATTESRFLLLGFFSDAYNEDIFQFSGYKRTPSDTKLHWFSNPISTSNVNEAYDEDAAITKYHDEYDSVTQASRNITGGGNLIIHRRSPVAQHAGGTEIGLGSIFLLHGGSVVTDPSFEFKYTGALKANKYGSGTFTGTAAYYLSVDSSGNLIESTIPGAVTNTNMAEDELTADDNQTHDFANFDQTWESLGALSIDASSAIRLLPYGVTSNDTTSIRFYELAVNGSNYIGLRSPDSVLVTEDYTLPPQDGANDQQVLHTDGSGAMSWRGVKESIQVACSDRTTALTTGTNVGSFRMPYRMKISEVRCSLVTAGTGANLVTIDINESGSSVLSTKLTIDANEKTSTTATTAAVLSDASWADDAEITIDIDQVDSGGVAAGLIVTVIGERT